jgi:hypothetical protein
MHSKGSPMKTRCSILLAALALVVSATSHAAATTDGHPHASHGSANLQKLQLNAGKKWASDALLRQTMNDINQAMAKALPLIHKNRFGNGDYQALATTVSQKVAYAVEHCKLEPKADAMLHLVIAELIAGAETMEGKTAKPRRDGAVRIREALKVYGEYFQHPGWEVAGG